MEQAIFFMSLPKGGTLGVLRWKSKAHAEASGMGGLAKERGKE